MEPGLIALRFLNEGYAHTAKQSMRQGASLISFEWLPSVISKGGFVSVAALGERLLSGN
jgi:hypothetical protein